MARSCLSAMGLPLLRRLPSLPQELTQLPGWRQRRRVLQLWAMLAAVLLLRSFWPVRLVPGWWVGALLLWAVAELLRCCWWPRRWR